MEDDLRPAPTTLAPAGERPAEGSQDNRSASLIDRVLQRAQHLSYSVCDLYLRLRGIHDDLPPSIIVAIPVVDETKKLTRTIESLLSAQYVGLGISLVGPRTAANMVDSFPRALNIQFVEAQQGTSTRQSIRAVLMAATSPMVAWLNPGDTLMPAVLHRVGEISRRNRRIGCVLVSKEARRGGQWSAAGRPLDFASLWAQDFSLPAKVFVRRELFWGATRTFAGTDYDFNDWAVALNTARFSRVRVLAGGFYESAGTPEIRPPEESQKIKSTMNAQMWCVERVRHRFFGGLHRLAGRSPENGRGTESPSPNRSDTLAPPAFVESLAGLYAGEHIELLGSYRWSFAEQPLMARSIFFDQANELLAFRQLTGQEQYQNGSEVVELAASPEKEQRSRALAQRLINLLSGLPEQLREEFGESLRTSFFPLADPSAAPPTPDQVRTPEPLFDFVVIERALNVSLRPHVLLRAAANRLKWEGWLIFACTVFDVQPIRDSWPETAFMAPDYQLAFSRKSLGNLLDLAGFAPRHVLGLADSQVENLGPKLIGGTGRLGQLVHKLFQADANFATQESYLFLACQRRF
jgi:hypothetical protein